MSRPIPFTDTNFKLAVVQELMYNQGLLPRFDLREHAAEKGFTYDEGSFEAVPEALAYFAALEVPGELAENITEIYMDGGVRSGLDVLKALRLGAKACFVGRAWADARGAGGQPMISKMRRATCGVEPDTARYLPSRAR